MSFRHREISLSFLFLVVPFFVILAVPFQGLGLGWVKLKLTYPFILIWTFLAIGSSARVPSKIKANFYLFWLFGLLWYVCFKFSGFHAYGMNWYIKLMSLADCFCTFFPALVFFYCVSQDRLKELRLVFYIVLFGLVLQSLFMFRIDAGANRMLAWGMGRTLEETYELEDLKESGALGYAQVYGLVLILIGFLCAWKSVWLKKQKILIVALGIIYLIGVYRAQYSTSIGALLFGAMLTGFGYACRQRRSCRAWMFVLTFLAILLFAFPTILSFMSPVCKSLAESLGEGMDNYKGRLLSLAELFSGVKDTYAANRFSLYWQSLEAFANYPLCGATLYRDFVDSSVKYWVGGHSTFFDTLGMGGLLYGSFYILWMTCYCKFLKRLYCYKLGAVSEAFWGSCWFCCFMVYLLISCVNTATSFINTLTFVIPTFPFIFGRPIQSYNMPIRPSYRI